MYKVNWIASAYKRLVEIWAMADAADQPKIRDLLGHGSRKSRRISGARNANRLCAAPRLSLFR